MEEFNYDYFAIKGQSPSILIIGKDSCERCRLIKNILVTMNVCGGVVMTKHTTFMEQISEIYNLSLRVYPTYQDILINEFKKEQLYLNLPNTPLIIDDMFHLEQINQFQGPFHLIVEGYQTLHIRPLIVTMSEPVNLLPCVLNVFDYIIVQHEPCCITLDKIYLNYGSIVFPMFDDYLKVMSDLTKENRNLLINVRTKEKYSISTMPI